MRLFEGTEFDIPPRCERCNELEANCQCEPLPEPFKSPEEQKAIVSLQKRKKGKQVTVVSGLLPNESDLDDLTKNLKNYCGAGGTLKHGDDGSEIEIQGSHLSRVEQRLSELGYRVKVR